MRHRTQVATHPLGAALDLLDVHTEGWRITWLSLGLYLPGIDYRGIGQPDEWRDRRFPPAANVFYGQIGLHARAPALFDTLAFGLFAGYGIVYKGDSLADPEGGNWQWAPRQALWESGPTAALTVSLGKDSPPPSPPDSEPALPIRRLHIGVRGGPMTSVSYGESYGYLAGFFADYAVVPQLRLGVYVDQASASSISNEMVVTGGETFDATRFGARVAAHPMPRGKMDPFMALSFGGFHATAGRTTYRGPVSAVGIDVSPELGADIRLTDQLSLGGAFVFVIPLTSKETFGGKVTGGGTYYTAVGIPLPLLRLTTAW